MAKQKALPLNLRRTSSAEIVCLAPMHRQARRAPLTVCLPVTYNGRVKPAPKPVRQFLAAAGRKGGKTRATRLTPARRRAIARRAARARWKRRSSS